MAWSCSMVGPAAAGGAAGMPPPTGAATTGASSLRTRPPALPYWFPRMKPSAPATTAARVATRTSCWVFRSKRSVSLGEQLHRAEQQAQERPRLCNQRLRELQANHVGGLPCRPGHGGRAARLLGHAIRAEADPHQVALVHREEDAHPAAARGDV